MSERSRRELSIRMVLQKYPPELGGAEAQAARLSARLRALGHDVAVWTIAWRPLPARRIDADGTPVLSCCGALPPRVKTWAFAFRAAWELVRERDRVDIVHYHLLASHSLVGAPVAKALGMGVIVKFGASGKYGDIGAYEGSVQGRLRLKFIRKIADRIVVLNPEMRLELEKMDFPAPRIACMVNGLDVEEFVPLDEATRGRLREELGLPPGNLVTFTGFFKEQKELPSLIDAFALVRAAHPDAVLVLAGEGPVEPQLRAQVAERGLERVVHFTGPLERPQVRRLLQASDLFVLPSAAEGLSNSLLEAMAVGLASVVSAIPGNEDLIDDGVHGLRHPVGDRQAIAAAINRLLEDKEGRERMGKEARGRVVTGYSIEAVARQYEQLYLEMLEPDARAG